MKSFQKKDKKLNSIIHSKPALVVLGCLTLFFAYGVLSLVGKMQTTSKNRQIIENKVKELKMDKAKLTADISKLQTKDGVEESIREKFGWAKEGEGLVVVIEDQSKNDAEQESSGGFWGFVKNLFD
jgi:cell division protein FtsB